MGGGISVLLPDMAKQLNQVSLAKFHELESECVVNNLSAVDMYLFLTAKYEELVIAEKQETVRIMREQKRQEEMMIQTSFSGRTQSEQMKKPTKLKSKKSPKKSWGICGQAVNNAMVKSRSRKSISKCPSSLFSTSNDSADGHTDLSCSSAEDIKHSRQTKSERLPASTSGHVQSMPNLPPPLAAADAVCGMSTRDMAFECKLCKKIFDTQNMLDTHYAHSQIHAKAVQERNEKFAAAYKKAEHLAGLAKESVVCLKESRGMELKQDYEDGFMTLNKYRWKHAVSKVIDRYLKTHYETIMYNLNFTPFDSADVKLMYTGTKFFWRVKATFNIHIYLHVNSDCLEVVPQLLPGSLSSFPISEEGSEPPAPASLQEVVTRAKLNSSKRIYLSNKLLKDQMPGLPKRLVEAGTSIRTCPTQHQGNISPPNCVYGGDAHRPQQDIDLENEAIAEAEAALAARSNEPMINATVDDALTLFVLNRLRVDHLGVEDGSVELHNSVYFESYSKADTPLLALPPRNLCPVAVESAKMYQQWEVKLKMKQLRESERSLADAVNQAMSVSERTQALMSPSAAFRARPIITTACDAQPELFSPKNNKAPNSLSKTRGGVTTTSRRWTFAV